MSTDQTATLASPPTQAQVGAALDGYLNGAASVALDDGCWLCRFPQPASEPTRDLGAEFHIVRADGVRWFEVEIDGAEISVRTREQDEFVCAVADGFFVFACRFWCAAP